MRKHGFLHNCHVLLTYLGRLSSGGAAPKRSIARKFYASTTYTYHLPGQSVSKPPVPGVDVLRPEGEKGGGQEALVSTPDAPPATDSVEYE